MRKRGHFYFGLTPFAYSIGSHIADAAPAQQVAQTWAEFVAIFDAPDALRSPMKGGRYMCGPMNGGRRSEEAAAPANWIAFDFDKLASVAHRDKLVSAFGAMARCIWYETASSTPGAPRIRVVVALDRVATAAERRQLAAGVGVLLADQYPRDTNQDRPSQPLFLPLQGATIKRCDTAAPLSVDGYIGFAPPAPPMAPYAHAADAYALSDGPVPEWRGPTDDADLIRLALASKSAASAFGGRASFADLWTANEEALGRAYPDSGGRAYDASSADAALASHLSFWTGRDGERIARLMRHSDLVRDKWTERDDYIPRTVAAVLARGGEVYVDEAARRREQLEEAMRIGDGSDEIRLAGTMTLDEMLPRFVFVQDGQQVVDLQQPQHVAALSDWKATFKASQTTVEVKGQFNGDGTPKTKTYETAVLWEKSHARQIAQAVTFLAGGKRVVRDPRGREAVNTWHAPDRATPPGDPSPFLQHVAYLFGDDAPRFLDWLAHIEQRPGELPQFGWLHISDWQGTGRNWIASVIARLWPGYAAVNFDLSRLFASGFNDRLSARLLIRP